MSEVIAVLKPLLYPARGEGEATRTARVGCRCVRVNNIYDGEGYLSVGVSKSCPRVDNRYLRNGKLTVGDPSRCLGDTCLNVRMD